MDEQKLRVQDMPLEDRPRERIVKHGPSSLSNTELLAIILRTGTSKENVINLCSRIFANYSIKNLSQANITKLTEIHGVGIAKASQISAIFELARRLEKHSDEPLPRIRSPDDVYKLLYPQLRCQKKEHLTTLHLDTKNQVLREDVVSIGSLNANIVHPREVFKSALLESAASVILTHNHPSGDPTPSREDINITRKLVDGGKILGIDVLDHVIIGEGKFVSLKDEGYIS